MRKLLVLFSLGLTVLGGCATTPDAISFQFACGPDGQLYAAASFENADGVYVAEVGRCVGALKIIGQSAGVGT